MAVMLCFSATVTNLQAKVETLTTTNALMKEDLAIAKNNILSLYDENTNLKKELGLDVNADRIDAGGGGGETGQTKKSETNSEVEELKLQLENERKQRQETEKELNLQVRNVPTSEK
jgi:hypothetical protein